MSFTNELSILPDSPVALQTAIAQTLSDIDNGVVDPLVLKARLKWFEKYVEGIKPTLDEAALTEAQKYGKGEQTVLGFGFRIQETGTKWHYENCGDPLLLKYETSLKDRQAFLQAIKEPKQEIVDDEIITINPPIKKSTTAIVFTLPKQ